MNTQNKIIEKLKSKRGSTLVLALCVFALIVTIGMSVIMVAGVSHNQTTKILGQKQADFSAESVLNSVIYKIKDGTINPQDAIFSDEDIVTGSGSDAQLGKYEFFITRYNHTPNLYKLAVKADYNGSISEIHTIMQCDDLPSGDMSQEEKEIRKRFENVIDSNGELIYVLPQKDSAIAQNIQATGSIRVLDKIKQDTVLSLAKGAVVTQNLRTVRPLILNGAVIGTDTKKNVVQVSNDITISANTVMHAKVYSTANIYAYGSQMIDGALFANGSIYFGGTNTLTETARSQKEVVFSPNAVLKGKGNVVSNERLTVGKGSQIEALLYSNGDIVLNENCKITGDIMAAGTVTVMKGCTIKGNITAKKIEFPQQSVNMNGNIISTGDVNITSTLGNVTNITGDINANGNVLLGEEVSVKGNVYGRGPSSSLTVRGDKTTVTGNIELNGTMNLEKGTIYGNISAITSYNQGKSYVFGSVLTNGDVTVSDFTAYIDKTLTASGNAYLPAAMSPWGVSGGIMKLGGVCNITVNGAITNAGDIPKITPLEVLPELIPITIDTIKFGDEFTSEKQPWTIKSADIQSEMLANRFSVDIDLPESTSGYEVVGNSYIISHHSTIEGITGNDWANAKKIVLDASKSDLYITLAAPKNESKIVLPTNLDIVTKGKYNVYLFIDDHVSSFYVPVNSFLGREEYINFVPPNDTLAPNLYLISNVTGATVDLSNGSVYAFVYVPRGKALVNKMTPANFGAKVYGAVNAATVDTGNGMKYIQYSPTYINKGGGELPEGVPPSATALWTVRGKYYGL
ncbi:MAG: hypothetical protein RR716_05775 [Christensenellaceae bacterium]